MMGSAIKFNISGDSVNGISPIETTIPSPNTSNGFGIINCLTIQKITANILYILIALSSYFKQRQPSHNPEQPYQ